MYIKLADAKRHYKTTDAKRARMKAALHDANVPCFGTPSLQGSPCWR